MRRWLRRRQSHDRFDRDLRAELRTHIDHRTDDLIRAGYDPAEARRLAHVEFGGVERYADAIRDERGRPWRALPESLRHDARMALRRLVAAPAFTFFAVLSLGLGLGVTVAVYALIYSVAWAPPAIPNADQLVALSTPSTSRPGTYHWASIAPRDLPALKGAQIVLTSIDAAAFIYDPITSPTASEIRRGEAVTPGYFETLGVRISAGRALGPVDEDAAASPVVVLNARLAELWYGDVGDAIGRLIRIGGRPVEVVGVAARPFDGVAARADNWTAYWIPLAHRSVDSGRALPDPAQRALLAFGTLRPDATLTQARQQLAALATSLDASIPDVYPRNWPGEGTLRTRNWQASTIASLLADESQLSNIGLLIVGLSALVLVVACTNLANLTLARGAVRARESAIRRALGASRARIVRELLIESTLLGIAGGAVGWLLTRVLLVWFTVDIPGSNGRSLHLEPTIQPPVVAAAFGALLLSLLVFGILPALRLTRAANISEGSGAATVGVARGRGPWRLIRWQVAAAVCFFLLASTSVRVVLDAAGHDSGIDLDRLAIASVYFDRQRGQGPDEARLTIERVLDSVAGQSGVSHVAATTGMPFGQTLTPLVGITTPDKPFEPGQGRRVAFAMMATPEIFQTLGVSIVRGRGFDSRHQSGSRRVAVLSQRQALSLFGTADAVDRELLVYLPQQDEPVVATVIGVASDTDVQSLTSNQMGVVYLPLAQAFSPGVVFVAQSHEVDPVSVATFLTSAILRVDPDVGLYQAGPARRLLAGGYVVLGMLGSLTGGLGALTLVLSMVGLYGVLSQFVIQRTREMGLRKALGATTRDIRRLALRQGTWPVLGGIVLGLLFGTMARGLARAYAAPVDLVDWWAMAIVPLLVLLVSAFACYVPARRASRVDPNVALRDL